MSQLETGVRQAFQLANQQQDPPLWSPPTGEQVKSLRERLGLTQNEFAAEYAIDIHTLQKWEQGRNVPEGAGRQILWMIEADPVAALQLIRKAAQLQQSQD